MSEEFKTKKISEETVNKLKRKSPVGMPDRPSEVGMKPEDIKEAFTGFILDDKDSIVAEINRIVIEVLEDIDKSGENVSEDFLKKLTDHDKSPEAHKSIRESIAKLASQIESSAKTADNAQREVEHLGYEIDDLSRGLDNLRQEMAYKDFSNVSFEYSDWEEIMDVIEAGQAQAVFSYGDRRNITFGNGLECTLVFLDLSGRHDVKTYSNEPYSDGDGYAPVTIGLLCTFDGYPYATIFGASENEWRYSALRTETMPSLAQMLPEEIRKYIVPVIKMTQMGAGYPSIIKTVEYCFPLSLVEITGKCKTRIVQDGEIEDEAFVEEPFTLEGEQYDFFKARKDGERGLGRIVDELYYTSYWTRSPYGSMNAIYIDGSNSGKICSGTPTDEHAIMFGFCVERK